MELYAGPKACSRTTLNPRRSSASATAGGQFGSVRSQSARARVAGCPEVLHRVGPRCEPPVALDWSSARTLGRRALWRRRARTRPVHGLRRGRGSARFVGARLGRGLRVVGGELALDAGAFEHLRLELVQELRVLLEMSTRRIASLADALTVERKP